MLPDDSAWSFIKLKVAPRLTASDPVRGWQPLFDILNQAYLKRERCSNVAFIPSSGVNGLQTPDLKANSGSTLVLCEVKTVNISKNEADRRYDGGVGSTTDRVEQGFFNKLASDLNKANGQMLAYDGGKTARKIAYVVVNFDDRFHEYADRYQTQIDQYVARNPVPDLEIVLDIKPPFYTAMS